MEAIFEVPSNPKLWVMQVDGFEPERLTSGIGFDMFGSWSPDGNDVSLHDLCKMEMGKFP